MNFTYFQIANRIGWKITGNTYCIAGTKLVHKFKETKKNSVVLMMNLCVSVCVWHLHDQVGEGEPLARKQGPSEQQSSLDLPRET